MLNYSKNSFLLFFFFALFSPLTSSAQVGEKSAMTQQDTSLAWQLLAEAKELHEEDQELSAIQKAQQARIVFEKNHLWEGSIKCWQLIARCYDYLEDLGQSNQALDEATSIARLHLPLNHYLRGNTFQQKAELFIQLNELDSAMTYFTKAIAILEASEQHSNLVWSTLLAGLVSYYQLDFSRMENFLVQAESIIKENAIDTVSINETLFQYKTILYGVTGEFEKELQVAEEALDFRLNQEKLSLEDSSNLAITYSMLGSTYFDRGDYNNAKHFYKLTIALQEFLKQDSVTLAYNYSNLGAVYHNELNYQDAIDNFKKSLAILSQYNSGLVSNRGKYTAIINMTRIYIKLEEYDTAQYYINQAARLSLEEDIEYNKNLYYLSAALIQSEIGQLPKAKALFHRSIDESIKQYGRMLSSGNSAFLHLGDIYLKQDSIHQALEYYQQGLGIEIKDHNYLVNPAINQISDRTNAIPILLSKSKALERLGGIDHLKKAYQSCQLAIGLIDKMRQEYETEGSRQLLSTKAIAVYEQTIKLAFQLHEQSKDIRYLEEAFQYSEKSKALLLLEALVIQAEASQQTVFSVSDELRQKEKSIKAQLIFYERKIFEEQARGSKQDSTKVEKWGRTLADFRSQYEQLRFQIKRDYPDYFNLKYDLQLASPSSIREQFLSRPGNEQTTFVEYFMGEEHLYTFLITQTEFKLFSQPVESQWVSAINQLQQLQSTNPLKIADKGQAKQHFGQYIKNAHLIYQKLLQDIIPASTDRLILIPDGILGYLSFDMLLVDPVEQEPIDYSSQHLQYLIEDYQLSYAYSGSLLLESLELRKKEAAYVYGGFAPFNQEARSIALERNCNDGELAQLPNSEISVNTIHQLLGGKKFLGEQASRQTFIDQVANYQLLHLSTHACVDDNNPLFNRIYFADQALSTYELYRLQLNAALVVLSACETGTGRLVHGEGIMSLARGFMKSGCPSIITSLWNANDFSTSEIMIHFFELLKEGQAKDEALRKAKLHYLNNAPPRLSSPYYWATFIHMGNNSPIAFSSSFPWLWLSVGAALLLLLFGAFRRFGKS